MEGVATELAPSDFVSQNYETLVALMQEENKKRSSQSLQARLNFGPEDEVSPPRHRKERRRKDNRRPPVFGRIGKQVSGTQTANLQNLDTHENNDRHINVRDRLGSRDVHSRLGQWRSPSESPPSSDSEDSRRKRRKRNKFFGDEDEDMSRPWRRQKVDAFTRRISDFSEDKKRRMPANVKTYDGTGDPDDHLKIFESAATIENWPQPVWCHMFNSTLVGNARNWFSKLPRRSIDGFEELRRAFRLNFTQRKKCARPCRACQVKQRPRESTAHDGSPNLLMKLMKHTSIHSRRSPPRTAEKATQTTGHRNNSGDNQRQSSSRNKCLPTVRGAGGGYDKLHPTDYDPKGDTTYRRPIGCTGEEHQEGKDKQRSGGKKGRPRDRLTPIFMWWSITIEINEAGHDIHRMYIDGGASADILYEHCFQRLCPEVKSQLNPATTSLTGFTGEKICAIRATFDYGYGPLQSARQSLPLFKTLKKCMKKGDFRWTTEAEEAFTLLKQHIAALPTLVISKHDASGAFAKVERVLLGEHKHLYRPHTAGERQILADFLIEKPETDAVLPQSEAKLQEPWILFTDGSSCVDGSGAGLILTNPEGMEFTYALCFDSQLEIEAEYEA
ncbi:hypothetical protein Tco_0795120 [Tanacetum coccineum]